VGVRARAGGLLRAPRTRRVPGALLLFCLLIALPASAIPILLPPGEDADDWAPYLALVDLQMAQRPQATGAQVELLVGASDWVIRVRGVDGVTRERRVPPPSTPRDREDVVTIADSLLDPPTWTEPSWDELASALPGGGDVFEAAGELPILPPAPAPEPKPKPPPEPPPAPPVAVVTPVPPLEPLPVAPEAPAEPVEPAGGVEVAESTTTSPDPDPAKPDPTGAPLPEELPEPSRTPASNPALTADLDAVRIPEGPRRRPAPWARGGVAYAGRQNIAPGLAVDVAGGVLFDRALRVGLEVSFMNPARITNIAGNRTSGDIDVGLVLQYVQPTIGLMFGVQLAVGVRTFEKDGAPFTSLATFTPGAEVGWNVPLGRLPLALEPFGHAQIDTRRIELFIDSADGDPVRRGVVSWKGGLRLVWTPQTREPMSFVIQPAGS